jgi:uncharacterized protein YndB with AHSA1/START domain
MTETIVWRLHLAASPDRVYQLLTTDDGRASFWAESAVEREGHIEFRFVHGMGGRCRITARRPPTHFAIEYFGSQVTFDLEPDGTGGTDLTLSTWGFAPEDRDHVLPGWLNVPFPLKAQADFAVDLRNHDPTRTWNQRYVDH